MPDPRRLPARSPRPSTLSSAPCAGPPPARNRPPPHPAKPLRSSAASRATLPAPTALERSSRRRTAMGSTCDAAAAAPPGSFAPTFRRRPLRKGVGGATYPPDKFPSASSPLRPSAGSSAAHSPCCKRYRSPRSGHTTSQLARPARTNSPPPPPAPHKHLPPPDPSAARQITEQRKRVPAKPPPLQLGSDSCLHCYGLDEAKEKGKWASG